MDEMNFRGFLISRQDLFLAMAEFDEKIRPHYNQNQWRIYAIKHEEKYYPPKELIRIATNYEIGRFSGGVNAANKVFRKLGFDIVLLDDSPDFYDEDMEDALDTSLSLERDLERIILNDLSLIEEGLKLFREGESVGVQLDTGVVGRLDILAIDKQGRYVVIELKAGEASDRVCGQILRYMGWVFKEKSGGKDVRGIIVANEFDEKIKYAVSILPQIDLRKYDVGFTISNVA
jgi:hypothetical protein